MAIKKNPTMEDMKACMGSKTTAVEQANASRKPGQSRVKVKCNCGYGNNLFIRGRGANLSWDKGHPLKNTKPDEWVWETTLPFSQCEFKILLNDNHYEQGENHHISNGDAIEYTPRF